MQYGQTSQGVLLERPCHFSLSKTLDCGQAFRWKEMENGAWHGVALGRYLKVQQVSDDILFYDTDLADFETYWISYFDLSRDYGVLFDAFKADMHLRDAVEFSDGIRVLNQDTWEMVCSFLFSQANNIPRIKGIIENFCKLFGKRLEGEHYSFPSAKSLDSVTVEDLAPIRAGYRAKYIVDAVEKVNSGEVVLEKLSTLSIENARSELQKIVGVGPKVSECILLFGAGHMDAFPKDVWMNRVLDEFYPNGLPEVVKTAPGIAQQVLFHYRRNMEK